MNDGHSSSPSCLLPSVCNAETHKPMSERKVTWPTFTCDWTLSWTKSTHSVLALALGRACVSGVLAVSRVTRQHRGSRFHSWFGAQGAAKTLVWNRILLRNPTQSRARARGKMDLYIIKHPPTHTHTHGQQLHCIFSTQQDTQGYLIVSLTRFIWRQKHRPWRRSLHMVIPFHPNTSTRSLTLSVTAPVYILVNKRWWTGESDTCVSEGGEKQHLLLHFSAPPKQLRQQSADYFSLIMCRQRLLAFRAVDGH